MLASLFAAPAWGQLVYVEVPGARRSAWENADGVLGRRFIETCRTEGTILDPKSLPAGATAILDGWRRDARDRVVCRPGNPARSEAPAAAPGARTLALGPEGHRVPLLWYGDGAAESRLLADLRAGLESWLQEPEDLRWEEVGEMLDLSREENTAFRRLEQPDHPLFRLREAFADDKRRANLALYLLRRTRPDAIGLSLDLGSVFETPVRAFWTELLEERALPSHLPDGEQIADAALPTRLAAERRFFARRLEASRGRIYGRLDRIFQSLYGELTPSGVLVIDGRDSQEPFVAVIDRGGDPGAGGPASALRQSLPVAP
ncbi:MAG: hypothetical protein KC729_01125 [Candidatus Eisenbacteria bacterium]|uniref:Uncharacterized protein n=1 Tax=Eiseniibacteriota bacterium TaxID=2212470 RepID=A0A956LV25_UNCEI|nr:hypothetical protein [Candidatus Eisenbacteria bacterium]